MAVSTDAMYNSNSRYLHKMYRIHFSTDKTLEVTKADYLMSSSTLEEACKMSNSPFGEITSNELELSLLSQNGMFNPKNTSSPYYGLIKRGVKIEAFIRPDEVDEWDPIGVFYVTDWNTSSNGMSAEVIAHDILYRVLNAPVPSSKIVRDVEFSKYIVEYFESFGINASVDESIHLVLPYGFTSGYTDNKRFLSDLLMAANADCFCKHDGSVYVLSKTSKRPLRATFKDSDQIISATIKDSLATDYDSASVTCNVMQESAEQSILSIDSVIAKPGLTDTELTKFSASKVLSVKTIRVESSQAVRPVSFTATADDILLSLQSTADAVAKILINGTVLETVSSVVSTEGSSAIELDNIFIQTLENANAICEYTDKYVNAAMPTLDLVIRGNPKLQIGDKIQVESSRYRVNYTGILTKVKYTYAGSLSCEVSLTADMTEEG